METRDLTAREAVTEVAELLQRGNRDETIAASAMALVLVGILVQAGTISGPGAPLAPPRLVLLTLIVAGLLRGLSLLALIHRDVLNPVSRLRRMLASNREHWRTRLARPPQPTEPEFVSYLQSVVADVHDRCYLTHTALRTALGCAGGFAVWTLLNVAAGLMG